jgi:hypothetical protein
MDFINITSLIKDLIIIFATLSGLFIGYKGLLTWWDQLQGKTEYELSIKLLQTLYKLEHSIIVLRSPLKTIDVRNVDKNLAKEKQFYIQYNNTREQEWSLVFNYYTELKAEFLNAQVLWGKDFGKLITPILELINELRFNLQLYLSWKDPERKIEHYTNDEVIDMKKIVYYAGDNDLFGDKIDKAIINIEDRVRPYLKKKKYRLFKKI